jgi:hypothetical protein
MNRNNPSGHKSPVGAGLAREWENNREQGSLLQLPNGLMDNLR